MPVWHEATRRWVREGRLALLGVAQEQHPDRTRLFAQWRGLDWPILWDPLNLMGLNGVPVVVAIDEHGIVRQIDPSPERLEAEFLNRSFPEDSPSDLPVRKPRRPDMAALRRQAQAQDSGEAWRRLGDALALWEPASRIDNALSAYKNALRRQPQDGDSLFRLGVCYRMRYDSARRRPGDFQQAVDLWGRALAVRPNVYIWRRRLQQYGPRLEKPYPFYDWVAQAEADLLARGETPHRLAAPLHGAEVAQPASAVSPPPTAAPPDPKGEIDRDTLPLIRTETVIVPAPIRPGKSARILIRFTPDPRRQVYWNNEAEPLRLWLDPPAGWQVSDRLLAAPQGDRPETREVRWLDFEVQAPPDAAGPVRLRGYALYYVCEGLRGRCLFRRQEIEIDLPVQR